MCELNNIKKNKGCFKIELKKNQGLLEILCTPKENENIIPKGQKELYLQIEDTINVIDSAKTSSLSISCFNLSCFCCFIYCNICFLRSPIINRL